MLYLSGFNEPDSVLVLGMSTIFTLLPKSNIAERDDDLPRRYEMSLFVRPKNKHTEMWDGPRAGIEGATGIFKADKVIELYIDVK